LISQNKNNNNNDNIINRDININKIRSENISHKNTIMKKLFTNNQLTPRQTVLSS